MVAFAVLGAQVAVAFAVELECGFFGMYRPAEGYNDYTLPSPADLR